MITKSNSMLPSKMQKMIAYALDNSGFTSHGLMHYIDVGWVHDALMLHNQYTYIICINISMNACVK